MSLLITSDNSLMFRDARPFGAFGMYSGGLHRWPMPGTVAGALRTFLGFQRSPDFFEKGNPKHKENIREVLNEPLGWMLPVVRANGSKEWRFLYPRPADAIVWKDDGGKLNVSKMVLEKPNEGEGTDLAIDDWLLPITDIRRKPAGNVPGFWHGDIMKLWWQHATLDSAKPERELGVPLPPLDIRMHVAIDPGTYTAAEGKLFASGGVRMEHWDKDAGTKFEYGIACSFGTCSDVISGCFHLGGERRTAMLSTISTPTPAPPEIPEETRFLRLQLLTPGNFGAWAPPWLLPENGGGKMPWGAPSPDFPCRLRLRSAFMGGWQPVSGWDYVKHKPKAMRKLVPSGAVYVVELENPSMARAVRDALWLQSLCADGSQEKLDGYGVAAVGNADCLVNERN